MKRFVLVFCCLLVLSAAAFPVFAAAGKMELVASGNQLAPGSTFTVEANISDTDAVMLCAVALDFDSNVLELTGGSCDADNVSLGQVITAQKAGTLMLKSLKKLSGKVFTFAFKVKANAPAGTYPITAKAAVGILKGEYIDATGVEITVTSSVGSTTAPTTATEATAPTQAEVQPTTEAPKPTEVNKPTGGVKPIETPKPTEGPEPTETPKPTEATKPIETVQPTESTTESSATATPETTQTVQPTAGTGETVVATESAAGSAPDTTTDTQTQNGEEKEEPAHWGGWIVVAVAVAVCAYPAYNWFKKKKAE